MRKHRLLLLASSLIVLRVPHAAVAAQQASRLRVVGVFDDHRLFTGAPSSSFLTAEKIERLSLVSDAEALSGRPFCTTNLYLNGVRVNDISAVVISGMGRGRIP